MTESETLMQRQMRDMAREISTLKKKASIALSIQRECEARAHELKLRAKAAELGLQGLQQDAARYRFLKTLDDWIQFQGYLECEPSGLDAFIDKLGGINGVKPRGRWRATLPVSAPHGKWDGAK